MELARGAREGARLYDIGFPLPRSWLYGISGLIVVVAAFGIGFVIANGRRPDVAHVERPAAIVADEPADDVVVVQAAAEMPRFPAFAPDGVIVVRPDVQERAFAAAETVPEAPVERVNSRRPASSAERRARLDTRRPARPPVTVASAEAARPDTNAEEPRVDAPPTRNEAPPAREYAEATQANDEVSEEESDNRSWYGSEEYRREVAERRREARRRR